MYRRMGHKKDFFNFNIFLIPHPFCPQFPSYSNWDPRRKKLKMGLNEREESRDIVIMPAYLKDILHTIINPEKNWKTDLLYKWNEIIGPLHDKVRIEKIYDNVLILGVFHSCWMQELYLLAPLLIKTINEKLDQPYIKEIRFKHIGTKHHKKKKIAPPIIQKKKAIILTQEDECALAQVTDPALQEALKAFRIRCYQEK